VGYGNNLGLGIALLLLNALALEIAQELVHQLDVASAELAAKVRLAQGLDLILQRLRHRVLRCRQGSEPVTRRLIEGLGGERLCSSDRPFANFSSDELINGRANDRPLAIWTFA